MERLAAGATNHGWWKEGAENPTMNAKMISDGLTVENSAHDGGRIPLRLSGRAALTPAVRQMRLSA